MPDKVYAPEYTPELSESYLGSLLAGIDDQGRIDEGRAHAELAARGLSDQVENVGSAVGAVRSGVARTKAGTIGQFNLDVANKKFSERMTDQARDWSVEDRNFGAAEAEKNRAFQKSMAEMGYRFQDEQNDFDAGGFAAGLGGSVLSSAVGGYFGGLGRSRK